MNHPIRHPRGGSEASLHRGSSLRFSIVTPSFNQARFIRQTILSVLAQKKSGVDYLVMDGGSSDDTLKILHTFSKKITYQSKKDKGQADAINRGYKKTTGDIFAYINSDDYYLSGALAQVERIFVENPEVMWLVGDCLIVDAEGKEIQRFVRWYKALFRNLYHPLWLHILNPFPQPAVFIRRQALKKIGLFNEALHYTMDYEMWLRLQRQYGQPFFTSEVLAAFRIHAASKGGSQYDKQFAEEERVISRYTKNPFTLWLHRVHNQCILLAYGLLKK